MKAAMPLRKMVWDVTRPIIRANCTLGGYPGSTEPGKDASDKSRVGGPKAVDQNDFIAVESTLVNQGPITKNAQ